ncbi:MAG: hypothetical protein JWO79_289 [Actinomycetia bacterium]|jgi:hypothetical protein|nr:hypothetical protein [Actinomycetes bacterium]
MNRSAQGRGDSPISRNGRIIAVVTILVVGAIVAVTKVSFASQPGRVQALQRTGTAQCQPAPGPAAPNGQSVTATTQNGRTVRNHWADGQDCSADVNGVKAAPAAAKPSASCPSAAQAIKKVPQAARAAVVQELSLMSRQFAKANQLLASGTAPDRVLAALKAARATALTKISAAITKAGGQPPANLQDAAAKCTVTNAGNAGNAGNGQNNGGQNNGQNGNNNGGNNNGGQNNGGNNNGQNGNNNGGNNNAGNINDPNKLGILGTQCAGTSKLTPHDGFQNGNRCVSLEMGEVGTEDKNPSLLITQFPQQVGVNQPFQIQVSTRNLIRDRFLGAAKGGYYAEMSLLDAQGLVRGHFHTACRMLNNTNEAPDAAPAPAFFVATEDNGGGAQPDQIVIEVPGLPTAGTAQCASWAGDGSHRIPMMQRANQTPAFDAVRIQVGGNGGNNNGGNNNAGNNNAGNAQNGGQQNAGQQAGGQQAGGQQAGQGRRRNN